MSKILEYTVLTNCSYMVVLSISLARGTAVLLFGTVDICLLCIAVRKEHNRAVKSNIKQPTQDHVYLFMSLKPLVKVEVRLFCFLMSDSDGDGT